MENNLPVPNNNVNREAAEYKHKTCAGWDCKNDQTHFFKMTLLIGSTWFCDYHKKLLEKDGWIFCNTTVTSKLELSSKSLKAQTEEKKHSVLIQQLFR